MIIQSFGLEIRKVGNFSDLYKEVDLVLSKAKNIQQQTVAHALQKMFQPNQYFDVCFIRTASELCNIIIPKEKMLIYETIHCLHWSEMTQDYRTLIMAMVLEDFKPVLCPS